VRELANVVERAVVLITRPLLTPELFLLEAKPDSPEPFSPAIPPSTEHHNEEDAAPRPVLETIEQTRAACERTYLVHVLTATRGTVARAARLAGMHRGPFYKLLQTYTLDPEAFRKGTDPL
jgi:two-component system response regulator GlrR